jgi:ferredoxin-NADP reductase
MNERNVCVGDVFAIGEGGAVLQVSLPRQPCYKLNHRFQLKNFAPNTYKLSRTGWYYRCLAEGYVQAGDRVVLRERKWPQWTIERVQEYLHRNLQDCAVNEELAKIEELGEESRNNFQKRVKKHKAQTNDIVQKAKWRKFTITEKERQTPRIYSFTLTAANKNTEGEKLDPGTHATIRLPNGLLRTYSIVSGSQNKFQLGIALEEQSRGGSRYLHESTSIGDIIEVGVFSEPISIPKASSNHLFIIGGIGITAFLPLFEHYRDVHYNFEVHYAVRSADEVPFRDRLDPLVDYIHYYDRSLGERMDINNILSTLSWNTHIYVCGPTRMILAVKAAATLAGFEEGDVHYEAFHADVTGDPFEAEVVNRDGKVVQVKGEESLLEALRSVFGDVESSCEVGNCGTCKVGLLRGRVEHRGSGLSSDETATAMLSCVSRGIGRIAIKI